jgi:hypothetical protein
MGRYKGLADSPLRKQQSVAFASLCYHILVSLLTQLAGYSVYQALQMPLALGNQIVQDAIAGR